MVVVPLLGELCKFKLLCHQKLTRQAKWRKRHRVISRDLAKQRSIKWLRVIVGALGEAAPKRSIPRKLRSKLRPSWNAIQFRRQYLHSAFFAAVRFNSASFNPFPHFSQGTLSDLLRNPKPWSKLKSGRETFRRMQKWLQEPEFQRMSALRLAACRRKEEERSQRQVPTKKPRK